MKESHVAVMCGWGGLKRMKESHVGVGGEEAGEGPNHLLFDISIAKPKYMMDK